jgi:2,4-dienoyl-CoA reductase (NADPH2)
MTDVFLIYLKASEIIFMQDFLANPQKLGDALQKIGMFNKVADQYSRATGR